ncbi:hypothetical protein K0G05_00450 [Phocaeicola vulgatus]|uniref:Uncharacterized protein n=1 Tax=Phocaeicola dorei TaxID=357276 RepID=A0A4R4GJF2_9BACT|nr:MULTISPECIES: hypothetical protein [Bacteroidaceae]MCB6638986.1 hypothetical protein [Phocaeicola vulgatus]MCE8954004.1 hypothetical protein [Phocaeicola vulgatus]QJR55793.1 hypothetical protein GN309_13815 [Phocaeicola dorei]QJR59409.1 hypothetical protein GN308_09350 [Phocaeicola dorei]TDA76958.1 hypothetical protein E1I98_11675 [Phocaeicola dorei]
MPDKQKVAFSRTPCRDNSTIVEVPAWSTGMCRRLSCLSPCLSEVKTQGEDKPYTYEKSGWGSWWKLCLL